MDQAGNVLRVVVSVGSDRGIPLRRARRDVLDRRGHLDGLHDGLRDGQHEMIVVGSHIFHAEDPAEALRELFRIARQFEGESSVESTARFES